MKIKKIRHKVAKAQSNKGKEKCSVPMCLCASVPDEKGFTPLEINSKENLVSNKTARANEKVRMFPISYGNVKKHFLSLTGFTLMELMVVIAIIVLLAGIMTPNVARRLERAKLTRAEADIAGIETAIAMYENDLGTYPPGGIDYLETCLTGRDSTGSYKPADNRNWHGPYIKGIDKDAWGKEYIYIKNRNPRKLVSLPLPLIATQYPVVAGQNPFDYPDANYGGSVNAPDNLSYYIFSRGKNKDTGTAALAADDVNNWDVKASWREEY